MAAKNTPTVDRTAIRDNVDIAILSRVNTLAERFGLNPWEFTATLEDVEEDGRVSSNERTLMLEHPRDSGRAGLKPEERREKFTAMCRLMGFHVWDTDKEVAKSGLALRRLEHIEGLDNAISKAPRPPKSLAGG